MRNEYVEEDIESLIFHIEYEKLYASNISSLLNDIQKLYNKEAIYTLRRYELKYKYVGRIRIRRMETESSIDLVLDFLPLAGYVLFNNYPMLREISVLVAKRLIEAIRKDLSETKEKWPKIAGYYAEKIIRQLRKAKNIKKIRIKAGNIEIEAEMK